MLTRAGHLEPFAVTRDSITGQWPLDVREAASVLPNRLLAGGAAHALVLVLPVRRGREPACRPAMAALRDVSARVLAVVRTGVR